MKYWLLSFFIISFILIWTLTGCSRPEERRVFGPGDLKKTEIIAQPVQKIEPNQNLIYCSTFQLAWNELKDNVVKADIRMQNEPPLVQYLNHSKVSKQDINDKYYVAMAGAGKDNIIERINQELKQKFSDSPAVNDHVNPNDYFAYAYLYKNLEFVKPFERFDNPLQFAGTKVASFGIKKYNPIDHAELAKQVEVIDYRNDDDFIVSLLSKENNDELVLAKVQPGAGLDDTYREVVQRVEHGEKTALNRNDSVQIPVIDFIVDKEYSELLKKNLVNPGWEQYFLYQALQRIDFRLNEKGAILKSEAKIGMTGSAPPPAKIKNLIFDKPFLLYMKEKGAENPYLILWVDNAEILLGY